MLKSHETEIRTHFAEFLYGGYDFELFLTGYFANFSKSGTAFRKTKRFLNKYRRLLFRGARIAGVLLWVISEEGTVHVHILLISDKQAHRTINDMDFNSRLNSIKTLNAYWKRDMRGGSLKLIQVYEIDGLKDYLAGKDNLDLNRPDSFDWDYYKPGLLARLRCKT